MATNRFQFSDDFVLKNGRVGINSADPQAELDVRGTIKADNLTVTGVATFTAYEGFLRSDYNIDESLTITNGSALSGEVIVGTGVTATNNAIDYAGQGQIDSLKVYNTFTPPRGGTEERPTKAKPGQLYYNEDFKTIEFYDGNVWRQVDNTTRSGRGLFAGGSDPGAIATIQKVQISTRGNAQYFGDRTIAKAIVAGFGNETRGVFAGGSTSGFTDIIDYVTTASSGDAINFGDLLTAAGYIGGLSSSTRGIMVGDYTTGESNVIQYVQINTTGDAVDFGDLTLARLITSGATSSPTRGVMGGGWIPGNRTDIIDYITIASTGDAIDFGDLTQIKSACSAGSTGTRAVWAGGYFNTSNQYKTIEYLTIASGGNAIDFGERTFAGAYSGAASSHTRLVTCMGFTPANTNRMDSIEMNTGGGAVQFGDAVTAANAPGGCSDSHGGLGGF